MSENVKTAVVTGGHSFDVLGFHKLFRGLVGVDAYIQHIDDFASSKAPVRDSYDVVLFYFFMQDGPTDEGLPWYAGRPKTALEHLGETEQGIVVLHHGLLAYRGWPVWSEIVGVRERGFGYTPNQQIRVEIANPDHPITQGLSDWDMIDETYTMADAGVGSEILLTTTHPQSMRTLAWTRTYKNARVFCFESGHDNRAFANPGFRAMLTRGIRWAARKI